MPGKRLSASEVLSAIINDSDSENEPELDDLGDDLITDGVNNEENENRDLTVSRNDENTGVQSQVNLFDWEISDIYDPFVSEWLQDYRQASGNGVLVDTSEFDPKDYFKLFFPESVFELMSENTNKYAQQYFDGLDSDELPQHSRFRKWSETCAREMKKYISLQIAMGLNSKPEIEDYWGGYWLTYSPFTQVMPRNRYELLSSFLHFNDNQNQPAKGTPEYDPLYKVRPLIDIIEPTYAAAYCPERELSIDESMIKFKGRVFFRQYMPAKPTKWGIKQFALCESKTGFALKFLTYTGKNTRIERNEHYSVTEQIVLNLIHGYENKGHIVYTDNFYTSPNLCSILEKKQIGMCGTVKSNRKNFPDQLKPNVLKLSKGDDPVFMRSDNLVACAWQDTKRVHFVSTVHNNLTMDKRIRSRDGENGYRETEKPVMAEHYNKFMSGVDLLDQQLGTYAYPHKSQKWYHTIYHRMREVALVNGYILFCKSLEKNRPKPLPRVFREQVIQGLLEEAGSEGDNNCRRVGRPSIENPERLTARHFIRMYENAKEKPDCHVCSDRKKAGWKRKQTRYFCGQCKVSLCVTPCFEIFHTKLDYRQYAAKNIYNL